jgi:hypothetical protein
LREKTWHVLTHFIICLIPGENMVSKSSIQVQTTGQGEGDGGTESTQSGWCTYRVLLSKQAHLTIDNFNLVS